MEAEGVFDVLPKKEVRGSAEERWKGYASYTVE
jgi:hypothetical protein